MVQAAVDTGELSAHQKARASNMQGGYRHDATFVTRIVGSEFSNDLCSILLCFSIQVVHFVVNVWVSTSDSCAVIATRGVFVTVRCYMHTARASHVRVLHAHEQSS